MASTSEVSSSPRLDPLLRDLSEKKQSFRRSVVSLAAELKDVRTRLATQEESVEREARERKIAEKRAKKMEEEIIQLQRSLKEKDEELQASASFAEQNMKELEKLREELSSALASAEATSLSNQSAETRCFILRREIEEKNLSLKEHEDRASKLGEQLALLQKDILERECTQHSFKGDMLISTSENGKIKESDARKILEEILPMNLEFVSKKLNAKDEEIMKLREEIRFTSAQWKHKAKELENQLERHQRADQELKKRVVKLEFCLQETRSHARRLQKMNEKREKEIEELMDKLAARNGSGEVKSSNFWESSGFKMVVSMSMLVLVVFSKRVEVKSRIQRNSTFLGSLSLFRNLSTLNYGVSFKVGDADLWEERISELGRRGENAGDGDCWRVHYGGISRGDVDWAPLLRCPCFHEDDFGSLGYLRKQGRRVLGLELHPRKS